MKQEIVPMGQNRVVIVIPTQVDAEEKVEIVVERHGNVVELLASVTELAARLDSTYTALNDIAEEEYRESPESAYNKALDELVCAIIDVNDQLVTFKNIADAFLSKWKLPDGAVHQAFVDELEIGGAGSQ